MRVAVVADETTYHVNTDATTRIEKLTELLANRGHEVTVFTVKWWEAVTDDFEAGNIPYQAVTAEPTDPGRRFATKLPRRLRQFDPEIIHATHSNPIAIHTATVASAILQAPLIVDWYEYTPPSGIETTLQKLAAKAPHTVVTPSRLVETGVRELGRPASAIDVIPNSIEMELIRDTEPDRVADIVYSRVLDPASNLENLLLSLAELRDLDWTTAVIGDGPERDRYENQAADLRIDDRVQFLGNLSLERRIQLFKGAHVCVHTALRTPFPTDFLRALACGCIGIAEYHAESSAHELIEGLRRGFRTTTESELVDAIHEAAGLEHRDIDEHFARFDERSFLEQYLEIYRSHLF